MDKVVFRIGEELMPAFSERAFPRLRLRCRRMVDGKGSVEHRVPY